MNNWKCRYAPSLGALENTPFKVWGTEDYNPITDVEKPTVWFGLYGFPDFYSLWRHKGRKAILWAGSDILHFLDGYWLDDEGKLRLDPKQIALWINIHCESYVENKVEQEALRSIGVESLIVPSFLDTLSNYEDMQYVQEKRPMVYLSCGKDRQIEYGFETIENIADKCNVDFYLYGDDWQTERENIIVRGRVSKELMNEEIKHMQAGIRLNEFDGFSEVLAKSVLLGQYPISRIQYPFIDHCDSIPELINLLNKLHLKSKPNIEGRNYYLNTLNKYPWASE